MRSSPNKVPSLRAVAHSTGGGRHRAMSWQRRRGTRRCRRFLDNLMVLTAGRQRTHAYAAASESTTKASNSLQMPRAPSALEAAMGRGGAVHPLFAARRHCHPQTIPWPRRALTGVRWPLPTRVLKGLGGGIPPSRALCNSLDTVSPRLAAALDCVMCSHGRTAPSGVTRPGGCAWYLQRPR